MPQLQVARALDGMLDEEADQLVAVLDAQRATTLQVTRKVNYIKQLAALLNQVHLRLHCTWDLDIQCLVSQKSVAASDHSSSALSLQYVQLQEQGCVEGDTARQIYWLLHICIDSVNAYSHPVIHRSQYRLHSYAS